MRCRSALNSVWRPSHQSHGARQEKTTSAICLQAQHQDQDRLRASRVAYRHRHSGQKDGACHLSVHASDITVHKSQEATYSDVVHEYDRRHPQKLVYADLSRCTDVNRLYITNAKGYQTFYNARENQDHGLLGEVWRLYNHYFPSVTKTCAPRLVEPQDTFALAALNVTSLRLYVPYVVHNALLRRVSLLCPSETCMV